MSVQYVPLKPQPLLYRKTGVCRGKSNFLILFSSKTYIVGTKNNEIFFLFYEKKHCILHGWASFRNLETTTTSASAKYVKISSDFVFLSTF